MIHRLYSKLISGSTGFFRRFPEGLGSSYFLMEFYTGLLEIEGLEWSHRV